jgi:hypothetical protein
MRIVKVSKSIIFLFILIFNGITAIAQWASDPTVNNPICTATFDQENPVIISDGSGGVIIAYEYWHIFHTDADIYAQRVDANGVIKWTIDGIPISEASLSQQLPSITSDGQGGAIITWYDNRSGNQTTDIYAQRIDSNGAVQWTTDGIAICTASYSQYNPQIISDGSGGAIIAWEDNRFGSYYTMYAQRVDANGNSLWASDGVPVCNVGRSQSYLNLISDGSSGAIFSWKDEIVNRIYTQRINASGDTLWKANGVLVANRNGLPVAVGDGSGGAIYTWTSSVSSNVNIYAQHINAFGDTTWAANGILICTEANQRLGNSIVTDGAGGAIITWQDFRNSNYDIYAQRISGGGTVMWTLNGVEISLAAAYQQGPKSIRDDLGGAIITWYDYRNGNTSDIYAQRIDGNGIVQWLTDGVPISTANYAQTEPIILTDENNGAIIAWPDHRNSFDYDIYAQKLNADGTLGTITSVKIDETLPQKFMIEQNYPNPFNPSTKISFSIPQEELVTLKVFNSLGEEVDELINETMPAGSYLASFNAVGLSSGVYFYQIKAGSFNEIKKMMLIK